MLQSAKQLESRQVPRRELRWSCWCAHLIHKPFGAPMKYDGGECCAPFTSKNYSKHTLEYPRTNFGWFGNFSFLVKFWLMRRQNTRKLSNDSWANSGLKPLILSIRYLRKRLRSQFLAYTYIKDTTSPRIHGSTTFALNRIFCPSGPPWSTTEESAAHHLHQKPI